MGSREVGVNRRQSHVVSTMDALDIGSQLACDKNHELVTTRD